MLGPDRKLIRALGKNGTADGEFKIPHNVRVDACGRLWVASRTPLSNRESARELCPLPFTEGEGRSTPTVFSRGGSLLPSMYADARCIDASIVSQADRMNNRTQVFDANGKFIGKWLHGNLQPYGLYIDADEIYIAANTIDHSTALVAIFPLPKCDVVPEGVATPTDTIPCDAGSNAHWVAVNKNTKAVYVAEVGGNKMKKFLRE